ncbi:hypothetical protein MCOR02_011495 [Pyricularia oryzae]|nr:hypothetical protein MCOR01_000281 [Pyricularia oryzae]KAH9428003.1 hypothetical protein MCOR02_011495 [Pyricularia oryzae]KAI6266587.1 hypothetical protein MCOR26_010107 [Pyricularia oryzae]KAI6319776.1 hypothetical protein MCOR30_008519 [Pyricularia oryzae]KAI6423749.1 hypothetical protein MCOR22_011288 [Pyricularia oryzae]
MSELPYFPITDAALRNLVLNIFFLVLATLAIVARTHSRIHSCLPFWWDDWLLYIAWPFATVVVILQGFLSFHGIGYDQSQTAVILPVLRPIQVTFKSSYLVSLACCKASIICLYMRIFTAQGHVRILSHLALYAIIAWGLAFWVARMAICQPLLSTVKHCGDEKALIHAMNATNIVTDLLIIAIPQYPLWHLRLPLKDKLGLMSCFFFGIICIIVAIFRTLNNLNNDLIRNETGNLLQTTLLSSLEPCLAMICASMPMCRRLLSLPRPWWSRWTLRSRCARSPLVRATPPVGTPEQQQLPLMAVVVEPNPVVIRGHDDR